jgi:hypothetical protein
MIVTLQRIYWADCTTGSVEAGPQSYFSIEQPWRDNLADESCVPSGSYELIPYNSPTHGYTWQLHNPDLNIYGMGAVPTGGRDYCEIHAANVASQLEGCIALGTQTGTMPDPISGQTVKAVLNSRIALDMFVQLLGPMSTGHILNIIGATP